MNKTTYDIEMKLCILGLCERMINVKAIAARAIVAHDFESVTQEEILSTIETEFGLLWGMNSIDLEEFTRVSNVLDRLERVNLISTFRGVKS